MYWKTTNNLSNAIHTPEGYLSEMKQVVEQWVIFNII